MSAKAQGILHFYNGRGTAKKVAVEDLSQPVVDAIKTTFPDGTIEEVTLEDENGTEIYEAKVRANGALLLK